MGYQSYDTRARISCIQEEAILNTNDRKYLHRSQHEQICVMKLYREILQICIYMYTITTKYKYNVQDVVTYRTYLFYESYHPDFGPYPLFRELGPRYWRLLRRNRHLVLVKMNEIGTEVDWISRLVHSVGIRG